MCIYQVLLLQRRHAVAALPAHRRARDEGQMGDGREGEPAPKGAEFVLHGRLGEREEHRGFR